MSAPSNQPQVETATYNVLFQEFIDPPVSEIEMAARIARREEQRKMAQSYPDYLRTQEAKNIIARLGNKRFGPADADSIAALDAIVDIERLERIADRVIEASSWSGLLATL